MFTLRPGVYLLNNGPKQKGRNGRFSMGTHATIMASLAHVPGIRFTKNPEDADFVLLPEGVKEPGEKSRVRNPALNDSRNWIPIDQVMLPPPAAQAGLAAPMASRGYSSKPVAKPKKKGKKATSKKRSDAYIEVGSVETGNSRKIHIPHELVPSDKVVDQIGKERMVQGAKQGFFPNYFSRIEAYPPNVLPARSSPQTPPAPAFSQENSNPNNTLVIPGAVAEITIPDQLKTNAVVSWRPADGSNNMPLVLQLPPSIRYIQWLDGRSQMWYYVRVLPDGKFSTPSQLSAAAPAVSPTPAPKTVTPMEPLAPPAPSFGSTNRVPLASNKLAPLNIELKFGPPASAPLNQASLGINQQTAMKLDLNFAPTAPATAPTRASLWSRVFGAKAPEQKVAETPLPSTAMPDVDAKKQTALIDAVQNSLTDLQKNLIFGKPIPDRQSPALFLKTVPKLEELMFQLLAANSAIEALFGYMRNYTGSLPEVMSEGELTTEIDDVLRVLTNYQNWSPLKVVQVLQRAHKQVSKLSRDLQQTLTQFGEDFRREAAYNQLSLNCRANGLLCSLRQSERWDWLSSTFVPRPAIDILGAMSVELCPPDSKYFAGVPDAKKYVMLEGEEQMMDFAKDVNVYHFEALQKAALIDQVPKIQSSDTLCDVVKKQVHELGIAMQSATDQVYESVTFPDMILFVNQQPPPIRTSIIAFLKENYRTTSWGQFQVAIKGKESQKLWIYFSSLALFMVMSEAAFGEQALQFFDAAILKFQAK